MTTTKRAVRQALGFTKDTELADFFETTKQAVCAWDEDKPIPKGRAWELRSKRPDLFDGGGNLIHSSERESAPTDAKAAA